MCRSSHRRRRAGRQCHQGIQITHQSLTNALAMSANDIILALQALPSSQALRLSKLSNRGPGRESSAGHSR